MNKYSTKQKGKLTMMITMRRWIGRTPLQGKKRPTEVNFVTHKGFLFYETMCDESDISIIAVSNQKSIFNFFIKRKVKRLLTTYLEDKWCVFYDLETFLRQFWK